MRLRQRAQVFARQIIDLSAQASQRIIRVPMGSRHVKFGLSDLGPLGNLIESAYLPSQRPVSVGTVGVFGHPQLAALPNCEWARPWIENGTEVPSHIAYPYRIFFDRIVGQAYVFDQEARVGAIWVRRVSEMDLRSYITPFRLMLSWVANVVSLEVLHAAAVSHSNHGLIIMGPPGAGKSSLALWLGQHSWNLLSDDLVVYDGNRVYPVYARAKLDRSTQDLLGLTDTQVWRVPDTPRAKSIFTLALEVDVSMDLSAIVLPLRARRPALFGISARQAHELAAPSSLREILGGTARNHLRVARMFRSAPSFRVLVRDGFEGADEALKGILQEVSDDCEKGVRLARTHQE